MYCIILPQQQTFIRCSYFSTKSTSGIWDKFLDNGKINISLQRHFFLCHRKKKPTHSHSRYLFSSFTPASVQVYLEKESYLICGSCCGVPPFSISQVPVFSAFGYGDSLERGIWWCTQLNPIDKQVWLQLRCELGLRLSSPSFPLKFFLRFFSPLSTLFIHTVVGHVHTVQRVQKMKLHCVCGLSDL